MPTGTAKQAGDDGRSLRSPAGSTIAVEAAIDELAPPDIVIVTDLGLYLVARFAGESEARRRLSAFPVMGRTRR